jgi:hypothetical protein
MMLPMLPHDKANHALYGAALAALGGLHSVALGALLCAAGSIGWEVAQRLRRKGTPSVRDALAGIAGGALVLLPLAAWRLGWVG